jgi:hypothetical protein
MGGAFKVNVFSVSDPTLQGFGRAAAGLIGEHLLDGDEFTLERTVRADPNSESGVRHEGLLVVRRPYERDPDHP